MSEAARSAQEPRRERWKRWTIGICTVAVLLAAWEVAVDAGHVSERILASPSAVLASIPQAWDTLGPATAITAYEGLLGFAIAVVLGLALGLLLYVSRSFNAAVYPILVMAQTLPLITVAPLFVIWFGFEPLGKIVMVTIFALFPIAVQTYRGLRAVPRFYRDVALTCGAGRVWTLFHVSLRVAVGHIFGGLKIAAAYVFATAATAEYLGARNGLGIVLQSAFNSFRTPLIFAATLMIVLLTAALLAVLNAVERAAFPTSPQELAAGDDF